MALRDYARQKKVLVEAKLIEDRIENNQYLYGVSIYTTYIVQIVLHVCYI